MGHNATSGGVSQLPTTDLVFSEKHYRYSTWDGTGQDVTGHNTTSGDVSQQTGTAVFSAKKTSVTVEPNPCQKTYKT